MPTPIDTTITASPADAATTNPPAGLSDQAATGAQPADAAAPAGQAVEPWRDPTEIKRYFQRTQRVEDTLKEIQGSIKALARQAPGVAPAAPSTPVPADDRLSGLEVKIGWADARETLDAMDVAPSKDQLARLKALYLRERPSDAATWLEQTAPLLGIQPKAAPSAAPVAATAAAPALPNQPPKPTPAPIRTDLGAPGRAPAAPQDVKLIPADEWKRLPREQRMELHRKALGSESQGSPWAKPLPGTK